MPEDRARFLRTAWHLAIQCEVLYPLRVQMDFAVIDARQAFQQLGKRPLRPMPAVDERRNDREPQVNASRDGDCWGKD